MEMIDLSRQEEPVSRHQDKIVEVCESLGFDFGTYGVSNPLNGHLMGYAHYPMAWKEYYVKHNLQYVDPSMMVARAIAPVSWDRLAGLEANRKFFERASDFGITGNGVTIPVRGPYGECGLLSVTKKCPKSEWDKHLLEYAGHLQMAAVTMHDELMTNEVLGGLVVSQRLSKREKEIIKWTAAGKTHQDISDILNISHRTVEVHLRSIRTKLNALTTAQAVGRAVSMGICHPYY